MQASEGRPSNVFPLITPTSCEPQPTARTAGEIAEIYDKTDRTIQQWYKVVIKAYPWLKETDLKTGKSANTKYTVFFQELISDFRNSGMGTEEWIAAIHSSNADKLPKEKTNQERSLEQFGLSPAIQADVEVVEDLLGGMIQTVSETYLAQPIFHFNVANLTVTLPTVDTSGLDAATLRLTTQTAQGIEILAQFATADLTAKLKGIFAQNTHVAAAIQHSAVVGSIQDLGVGKPEGEGEDSFRPS